MACRLQVLVLGVATLSFTACYRNHTADEEEVAIGVPGDAAAVAPPAPGEDAGAVQLDAALAADAAVNCAALSDPLQQLACAAMQAGGTGNTGGLDIQDILGGLLGGGRGRDAGAGTGGQISIEDILGGLLDGAGNAGRGDGGTGGGLGGLVGSTTCNNPTDTFTQLLCGLLGNGSRDAGMQAPADPIGSLLGALTDAQCRNATQGLTQIICFLRDITAQVGRRDGGFVRRDGGFTPRDAGVRDAAQSEQDAASAEDAAVVDASEPTLGDAGSEADGSISEEADASVPEDAGLDDAGT